ncbi:FadR/GntR family transcriptional regulator [uncultured Schumannella sp.]|uniref:FadR/GntR family transcriptional regulator n=1 Tax=uncultured Schumannella sp. TaxID=1195956 RepID=UPI0025D8FCEA|nr:FadR/GntR family transcriptional regulator [uncultured Schumannella sp.]
MTEPATQTNALGGVSRRVPAARLGVAVVKDLVTAIVTGQVEPGEILPPEAVLSETFGVSRTVLRESVKRVEEKGMLTVAQGRGTRVNPPSSWNVLDPVVLAALLENDDTLGVLDELAIVRGALEGSMSAAAAERRTPDRSAELAQAFARMAETVSDIEAFAEADAAFHYVVMEQSENRLAANITRILFTRALETNRFVGAARLDSLSVTLDEHRAVFEAIERGDADGADRAMRDHIERAWRRRRLPSRRDDAS